MNSKIQQLNQYFTPRWVAQAIVESRFSDLKSGDRVVEPSCGDGRFLLALPDYVEAIGIDIDPVQAMAARALTGREVIAGNFLEVDLPEDVDAVIGNPPFVAETIAGFLDRSHRILREGGRCGFILPAYVLQTSSKVMRFAEKWSIQTDLMPRNVFPGLSLPITFTMFTKERHRKLFGLFLYREAAEVASLAPELKLSLNSSRRKGSVWRQAVNEAFDRFGSVSVPISELYGAVKYRPIGNGFCDQQIRKVLQSYPEFVSVARGVWSRSANQERIAV